MLRPLFVICYLNLLLQFFLVTKFFNANHSFSSLVDLKNMEEMDGSEVRVVFTHNDTTFIFNFKPGNPPVRRSVNNTANIYSEDDVSIDNTLSEVC